MRGAGGILMLRSREEVKMLRTVVSVTVPNDSLDVARTALGSLGSVKTEPARPGVPTDTSKVVVTLPGDVREDVTVKMSKWPDLPYKMVLLDG